MSSPSACPEVRAFLHERLDALLDDCTHVCNNAAYGRYIHDLDDFLYIEGRKFMREVLEKQVQERIQHVEATDEGKQCPQCKKNACPHPTQQNDNDLPRLRSLSPPLPLLYFLRFLLLSRRIPARSEC